MRRPPGNLYVLTSRRDREVEGGWLGTSHGEPHGETRAAEDESVRALALTLDDPLVTPLSLGLVECGVREAEHSL